MYEYDSFDNYTNFVGVLNYKRGVIDSTKPLFWISRSFNDALIVGYYYRDDHFNNNKQPSTMTDFKNLFTGEKTTFIYPDFETALSGSFEKEMLQEGRQVIFPHAADFLMRKIRIPHLSNGQNDLKLGGLTKNILLVQALEEFFP